MRHTSGLALTIAAVLGGVLGWALQGLLVFSGNPALTPPLTWGVALGALGALILALAWPIRSQVRGETKKPPVDPFYATRVVLLAQAGSNPTRRSIVNGCLAIASCIRCSLPSINIDRAS